MASQIKQNWFETLNASLESENLIHAWEFGLNIGYGQTVSTTFDDGTKHGHYISITRETDGRYERPVHYARG